MQWNTYKIKISLCILLFVNGSLWLFNGIIGWKRITFAIVCCGVLILCMKGVKLSKLSMIWFFYLSAMAMSFLINNIFGNWDVYIFLMYMLIILWAILIECDLPVFKTGIIFLSGIGIFNAVTVIIHFIFKEKFNSIYFPVLKYQGGADIAISYYERGYYFGVNYRPHETAGVICFTIAAFVIWGIIQDKYKDKVIYAAALCMFIPLMLTGKKGVTGFLLVVLMLILLVWYISKKQWLKICIAVGAAIVLSIIAVWYIMTHLDNPFYYRFASFFTRLSSGQSVDAGRGDLRNAAWELWTEHKIFGVGWFQFNGYTVSRYGFSRTHSVNLDYLQFLCETGIIGFVLMLTPIVVMIKRTVLVWKDTLTNMQDKTKQWIIFFAIFVQLFTVLYAFIEVPFYDMMYFAVYIFSCMIIDNAYRLMKERRGVNPYTNVSVSEE